MLRRMKHLLVLFVMVTVAVLGCTVPPMADQTKDLRRVAMAGNLATVQPILAQEGADVNANNGVTALMVASKGGRRQMVHDLFDKGVEINAKDNNGWTALMGASREGYQEVVQDLLDKGAEVNAKDNGGWTALMWASQEGHQEVVQALLDQGAEVNAKDTDGWTALMLASGEGHREVVRALLAQGAEVNAKSKYGWTALMWASQEGHQEVVQALLDQGAEVNAKDTDGWTALISAVTDLAGRWISNKIVVSDKHASIGKGWVITLGNHSLFSQEKDEGFGVVVKRSGTYRIAGADLVLRVKQFPNQEPQEERYGYTLSQGYLILTDEGYKIWFVRSDAPHPELSKLPGWPDTKQDAVAILKSKLPEQTLSNIARTPSHRLILYHMSLGMYIRNAFGLWQDNRNLLRALRRGEGLDPEDEDYDADWASGVIVYALWEDLNAGIKRPDFSVNDPEHYFQQIGDYLANAKKENGTKSLVFAPVWLLKDRPPHLAPLMTQRNDALVSRAKALVDQGNRIKILCLAPQ